MTKAKRTVSQAKKVAPPDLHAQLVAAEEKLQQAKKELAALNAIAATVSGSLELNALLADTLTKVLEVMQLPAGWIFLRDGDSDNLVLTIERGLSPQFALEEATLPLGSCACGEVLRTGQA